MYRVLTPISINTMQGICSVCFAIVGGRDFGPIMKLYGTLHYEKSLRSASAKNLTYHIFYLLAENKEENWPLSVACSLFHALPIGRRDHTL